MTVYVVGMITITDRLTYGRYRDDFMPVLLQHGGRLLAADEEAIAVEGEWPHEKLILIEFDDEPSFRRWMTSPEYERIARDRHAGSYGAVVLARGLKS